MRRLTVSNKAGEHVGTLLVDGNEVFGMHFAGLDRVQGFKHTSRVSDVEYDYNNQTWVAMIRPSFRKGDGPHHFAHDERDKCIEWEVEYMNRRYFDERRTAVQSG